MLKYLETAIVFKEVPDEISLAINITGCNIHCKDCHSPELWEDIGNALNLDTFKKLIDKNKEITCVCLLGGFDLETLNELFEYAKSIGLKTCWYTGFDIIPTKINLKNLDYIKIGHFNGYPISNPKSNQKFFKINNEQLEDITNVFWK